jgi:pantoate--beta-alanine ligase
MAAPTDREKDGLAVSPANARLSPEEREAAPALFRALLAGQLLHALGERKTGKILAAARRALEMEPRLKIDALDLVDAGTFLPVKKVKGPALLVGAVYAGDVRLTDRVWLG